MTKLHINNNAAIDYSPDWFEFKKWLDGTYTSFGYSWAEDDYTYTAIVQDGSIYKFCSFNKSTDESADFEASWKKNTSTQKLDEQSRPVMVTEPRVGSETIYSTHNFCDKVSWFAGSVRVDNKTLTSSDGYQWDSGDLYWIDMISGRVQDDDGLVEEQAIFDPGNPHGYQVIVTVDGYIKTMREPFIDSGGDYEVYWDDGYIKSFKDWTDKTVLASYSRADDSTFILRPLPGHILDVEAAEGDFTTDVIMKDTVEYVVYGYASIFAPQLGLPGGTRIPISVGKYKRLGQIINEALGSYPLIEIYGSSVTERDLPMKEFRRQSRGSKCFVQSIPFRYATVRTLKSSLGLELRVKLSHNIEFEGSLASLTFYCTSRIE